MSDLQNQTPADTYKGLLQVGDYTNGVDGNSEYVQDGEGTNSALSISTTKVGVGTVSPSAELDVNGNVVADEYALDGTGSSSSAVAIHAPTTNELAIRTNTAERVRIDSDGNCGIGTTSPSATLQVDANDNSANALAFWVRDVSRTNSIISAYENGNVRLGSFWYDDASGNLGLGSVTTFGTNATNTIAIKEGVSPTSSPSNLVQLFCVEDGSFAELRVRNEQGVETTLSPHAKDAPSSLYDRPPGAEEMHRNANYYLGTITFTNVDRRNSLIQKQLNGEELPEDRTFTVTETFAEYNARRGADLQVEDWDANQQAMADADESYVKKPKPEWLS